jgi:hypothetical protein
MNALSIALSEERENGLLQNIERGLFEYIVEKRATAPDELTSFSLNEVETTRREWRAGRTRKKFRSRCDLRKARA